MVLVVILLDLLFCWIFAAAACQVMVLGFHVAHRIPFMISDGADGDVFPAGCFALIGFASDDIANKYYSHFVGSYVRNNTSVTFEGHGV